MPTISAQRLPRCAMLSLFYKTFWIKEHRNHGFHAGLSWPVNSWFDVSTAGSLAPTPACRLSPVRGHKLQTRAGLHHPPAPDRLTTSSRRIHPKHKKTRLVQRLKAIKKRKRSYESNYQLWIFPQMWSEFPSPLTQPRVHHHSPGEAVWSWDHLSRCSSPVVRAWQTNGLDLWVPTDLEPVEVNSCSHLGSLAEERLAAAGE